MTTPAQLADEAKRLARKLFDSNDMRGYGALVAAIDRLAALADNAAARDAAPREHSPDDMHVPVPSADLKIGDYVFACRWGDGEPGDPWAVGWIEEISLTGQVPFVAVQGSRRGYRHAMKITEEQGARICALYPPAEELGHQERLAARAEAFGLATPSLLKGEQT